MRAKPHGLPEDFFPLVLVGLPGAGKTTVARELSRLVGGAGCDLDSEIKRRMRQSIPEIFATRGEAAFRDIETETLGHSLTTSQGVIALGGGALVRGKNREMLRGHVVIYLRVSPTEAALRVGEGEDRPLLVSDGLTRESVLANLYEQRHRYYEDVSAITVDTDGLTPAQVAAACYEQLVALAESPLGRRYTSEPMPSSRIRVGTGSGYRVSVGHNLDGEVLAAVRTVTRRILLVHPAALAERAQGLADLLRAAHVEVVPFVHPDGEQAKSIDEVTRAWDVLGTHHFTREDAIVALGGGATTDMAGFVAATWMRGIDVIQVPTSLLAMVDASVGGKTGINTPVGKNLVGSFYPPRAVIADLSTLVTLSPSEHRSGLGEVIKCGLIADSAILDLVEADGGQAALDPRSGALAELVERSIRVKAEVVTADLKETGVREFLNYGHTYGHAIERVEHYTVRHGDAVAQGMVFAAYVAREKGIGPADLVGRTRALLAAVGLPTRYCGAPFADLFDAMCSDKKVRGDRIRMVLLDDYGRPRVVPVSDRDLLARADAAQREAR